jgi:hypothetical protein
MFGYITKKINDILEWWFAIIFEIKVVLVEWIGLAHKGDNEMDRLFIHPYTHGKIFCHISKKKGPMWQKILLTFLSTSSKDVKKIPSCS